MYHNKKNGGYVMKNIGNKTKKEKDNYGAVCDLKNFVWDFPSDFCLIGLFTKEGFSFGREFARIKCKEIYRRFTGEVMKYVDELSSEEKSYSVILIINRSDDLGEDIASMFFQPTELKNKQKRLHTLVEKNLAIDVVRMFDISAAIKLKEMKELPVVVLDFGVVGVFSI